MHIEDRTPRSATSPQLAAFLSATNNNKMEDGWSVHGLWTPGVQAMRNLQFTMKAAVISVLFLIPIVISGVNYFNSEREKINFSAKELVGVNYLKSVVPLVGEMQLVRKVQAQGLVAGSEPPELRTAQDAVRKTLQSIEAAERQWGAELETAKALSELKLAVDKAYGPGATADMAALLVRHTEAMDKQFGLITAALDSSNLTLDPDIDTFYLMDASLGRIPTLVESTARIRDIAVAIGSGASASAALHDSNAAAEAVADFVEGGLVPGVAKVLKLHPEFGQAIGLETGTHPMHALHEKVAAMDESQPNKTLASAAGELGDTAVRGLVSSQAAMMGQLEQLLTVRLGGLRSSLYVNLALMLLSLLAAGYFFFAFYRVTDGGLSLIQRHLKEMAAGDLRSPPLLPLGTDEPAKVIQDLRVAYDSLHVLIRKVRHSARALHSAAGEISAASFDLGGRTESAAASLEEQASAMEEIGSTVSTTAQHAEMAATFAVDNTQVAERGSSVFGQVVSNMHNIHTSSSKISDIIGVIDGIAFQTNILALNAAVEAARAGEAGRGFAVVAAEVRTLAQRSAGAAREIKSLISASVEQVEGGTRVVQAAGQTMSEVVTNASQINQFLSEIAVACKEQALGVGEVAMAIQDLDKNTQQNAALVEQTNAAAAALTQQADELQAEIANFRVA